jgi:glycine/D-amino acid oxidase-like deaminating enzyme
MLSLPEDKSSYWRKDSKKNIYPSLESDIEVDVAIVGGGLCGLNCAYLLQKAGLKVAVLEKNTIGSGTSGHTTGKVTSQHNLFYEEFEDSFGEDVASRYAQANNDSIDLMETIIKNEKINCSWKRLDHIFFTTHKSKTYQFKQEAEVASKLGLPASVDKDVGLPFEVAAAVRFSSQARVDAQKYMEGLAVAITSNGGLIFEKTNINHFEDGKPSIVGTKAAKVAASDIIVATNVPTLPLAARGTYCILEYPTTSYVVAAETSHNLPAMYISPDKDNFSMLPVDDGLVLVGGRNHIRGLGSGEKRWSQLASYAQDRLEATSIAYKWSAWDYIAYDKIPVVGKMYPWSKHLYVATAFKKWGLTNTLVAAQILRDIITGIANPLAAIYTPHRLSPIKAIPKTFAEHLGL